MKVHHLNCGTMCPVCRRLINGQGGFFERARMVCHCLLVETEQGLVLVDTGLGTGDIENPSRRLGKGFVAMMQPTLSASETAVEQVKKLGYSPKDVRHIMPTHLDLDHAGGLSDFPMAQVHVYKPEHQHAVQPSLRDSLRYRTAQFAHQPDWALHSQCKLEWFGFPAIQPLAGIDILLVPLIGHTRGHVGVAVRQGAKWLLHCGDSYFHRSEVQPEPAMPMPPMLAFFEKLVQTLPKERMATQGRLRTLVKNHGDEVALFCAHDPVEFESFSQKIV
ncbi:MAG TPA: MBL fold metallo-hydrolase [Limnobacter sp.]|nr:MBL fold metallo-hydrolase [Limnobacter sp.]